LSNTTAQRRSAARSSARTTSRARSRPASRRPPSRTTARRRRLFAIVAALLVGATIAVLAMLPQVKEGIQELTLPLRHEDIIRQQARDKGLDPALIASMIYQESKFADRTSPAGARGLMQITPDTARFIAKNSGGTRFTMEDLATPQVNIAYGSWYLRYLLHRYDGRKAEAVAAYNAGMQNVDRWVAKAGGPGRFDPATIPFPETRNYVAQVMERRKDYARRYARELGL
jgi:soluble lytic murein transglycosylase